MALLPSYQDAISRLDWLDLVAPYIEIRDLGRLCAVNLRFNAVFAQRLWSDPLKAVRRLGLDPSDDLEWYFNFIFVHTDRVRASTLALVLTLDFRDFAKNTTYFPSGNDPRTIPESLRRIPKVFPSLRCVLLDGHAEIDPAFMGATPPEATLSAATTQQRPLVLSVPHSQSQLPTGFFSSDYVKSLVYLDISGLQGSLQPLIAAASNPQNLPDLRVLKVARRELGDSTAIALFKAFRDRLWSLDLRENNVTDSIVDHLRNYCLDSSSLRSESWFRTEGKLIFLNEYGNETYGPFKFIKESDWSGSFSHPERYFVDAPAYSADVARSGPQEDDANRSDGRPLTKLDTIDHMNRVISGGLDYPTPDIREIPHLDVCTAPAGVTHLHVANNNIITSGIEKLIRISPGQLEYLDCDSPPFQPPGVLWPPAWPKGTKVYGVLGSAYAFRPVYSSNLRTLRIHHSLVTQIPTLKANGLSPVARLWLAETSIRERCEMTFPQAFVPDMNPRLNSLTLTKIPRRAVGPLIKKLIHFLELAAIQERAIQDTTMSSSRRSPAMLRGIRHIRLELDTDPIDGPAGLSVDDLDAESLLTMHEGEGFSFFGGESATPRLSPTKKSKSQPRETGSLAQTNSSEAESGRLQHFPYSQAKSEFLDYSGKWNDKPFTAQVWIGPGILGPHPAVNEYMMMLSNPALLSNVGAASPVHAKAGVPEGVLLFLAAWDAMILPPEMKVPTRAELYGMLDVVEALKKFRLETRAKYAQAQQAAAGGKVKLGEPHFFWTGRLEVVAQPRTGRYRSANDWR